MHPLKLTEPVTIRAPNLWGFPSEIKFSPTPHPGWWWQVNPITTAKISPELIDKQTLRTRLVFGKRKLEIFEHIGILKWFGLDGVVVESKPWPPHFGCALRLWEELRPFCKEDASRDVAWYGVTKRVCWLYPKLRSGQVGFTEILPSEKPGLELEIAYSYPPIGTKKMTFSSINTALLEEICRYPSQGVSHWFYYLLKFASYFGAPTYKTATWPKDNPPEETMRRFVLHRASDLLGALSLLCEDGLFSGKIISHHGGHESDVKAILQAEEVLHQKS